MECKKEPVNHHEDKAIIKQEDSNQDQISTVSQSHLLLQNGTCFVECNENNENDTKIGIKQETWCQNVIPSYIKSDPEQTAKSLGMGIIKGEDEIHVKEEPWWCDGVATVTKNEEKNGKSANNEASEYILPLGSPRLPSKPVFDCNSFTLLDEGRGGTSHTPVRGNSARQEVTTRQSIYSLNPPCDNEHKESDPTKEDERTQVYKCEICDKRYTQSSNLKIHALLHSGIKPFVCDICKKCFTRKSYLQSHRMLHSGTKPYKCDTCEKCFTQKANLQSHKLIHLGKKPYKCDICGKCFTVKSTLQRHKLLHAGTAQYKCETCEKCFTRKSHLHSHILLHSGTKPLKCDICEKCFTWRSALKNHKLLHSGTKPYKCNVCEKYFTQKSQLQRHEMLHSGTKPYKCDICQKCFSRNSVLKKHILLHSRPHS